MNPRTWQRQHLRMTVLVVQSGPQQFLIPINNNSAAIPIDGSLADAQERADALSGCASDCRCPTWVACEDSHRASELSSVRVPS